MSSPANAELDVRDVPKPQRHPLIFARFGALGVGESFVLVNSHDPRHLHDEFERDQPGAFGWEYVQRDPREWRIRISRTAAAPAPRLLCNVHDVVSANEQQADAGGALWNLAVGQRQLDANVIHLQPGKGIDPHTGPDLDVLMLVVDGAGEVTTSAGTVPLSPGSLIWLPRRSHRGILAGPDGLSYLTVHPRRPGLSIASPA
jgi:uncharacterized protein (DUF2249 family)